MKNLSVTAGVITVFLVCFLLLPPTQHPLQAAPEAMYATVIQPDTVPGRRLDTSFSTHPYKKKAWKKQPVEKPVKEKRDSTGRERY
ncbi:hypothetical protein [Chitinophaga nivalis]|uniref:Uncharacterized protein n=1 Tax=Chitinophaga nivalis TaxID=2991709 RepID=A0ABT3IIE5_9BACT|nr:hypothetical protein [Chitinophaga nivalis]MCW3466569.1 hypothetical protein [Chitinophaga nivalis]MCW3483740.1 hypothetical protein [Chitinophaga nivalis]